MSTVVDPLTVIHGDALSSLRALPYESIQCCVTSPPYWGLRDYGTATWKGGDATCCHEPPQEWIDHNFNANSAFGAGAKTQSAAAKTRWYKSDGSCPACGAERVDVQIGLEKTPEEYVARLVEVFRELKRALRSDGVLWLNLGDSYATSPPGNKNTGIEKWATSGLHGARISAKYAETLDRSAGQKRNTVVGDLKPKDLVGIPWMVAFALRADGWYLRSDIIWSKPNPMPESVTDRPTKSHEYIFLLSKSERYYYDAEAIKEQAQLWTGQAATFERTGAVSNHVLPGQSAAQHRAVRTSKQEGKNSRLNVSRDPAHAHEYDGKHRKQWDASMGASGVSRDGLNRAQDRNPEALTRNKRSVWTVATQPFSGAHFATFPPELITPCILAGTPIGGTVIDPFAGSGTTGKVAIELGRKAILIEPKAEYVEMIKQRCQTTIGLPLAI